MSKAINANGNVVAALAGTDLVLGTSADAAELRAITLEGFAKLIRESIQIGGRNYALATSQTSITVKTGSKAFNLASGLAAGETVMFSFRIDWEGDTKPYMEVYLGAKLAEDFTKRTSVDRNAIEKGYNAFCLTAKNDLAIAGFYSTFSTGILVSDVKVERGNIATDWTPAPEDLGWGGKRKIHNYLRLYPLVGRERRCA